MYDATFGKESTRHILGVFAINEKAAAYTRLSTNEEIIKTILEELDEIFEGKASEHYVNHVIQNWSNDPYIRGAYSYTFYSNKKEIN